MTRRAINSWRHRTASVLLLLAPTIAMAQGRVGMVPVRIETSVGVITADLDSARAPVTVRNFLRYLDSLAYDGGAFHRAVTMSNQPRDTVRIEVIFGGHRNLDGQGFAVFGRVTGGMDVVRVIQRSPVDAQALTPPISIVRVQRVMR